MNIFLRELRAHRKSLIIWSICSMLLVASGMGKYVATGSSVSELMEAMPKSLKALLGGGAFDLSTAIGYYAMLFVYIVLMATIHASMLGSGIISKEERDKTVEFLMVKPVSRTRIVIAKLLAAVMNILIFNLATFVASIGLVSKYAAEGEIYSPSIVTLMVGMLFLQLLFMAMGAFIAGISKNSKLAGAFSMGILLLTFILSVVADMSESLEYFKYLTPFQYFDAMTLLLGEGFNPITVLFTLVLIAGLLYAGTMGYSKRDMGH